MYSFSAAGNGKGGYVCFVLHVILSPMGEGAADYT